MTLVSTTDGKMDEFKMVNFNRILNGSDQHGKTSLYKILLGRVILV